MNKVRKLAEELLAKYPTLFSIDFDANKKALAQVAVIRNRELRNQIAGTITALARERVPKTSQLSTESTLEEVLTEVPAETTEQSQETPEQTPPA